MPAFQIKFCQEICGIFIRLRNFFQMRHGIVKRFPRDIRIVIIRHAVQRSRAIKQMIFRFVAQIVQDFEITGFKI